jgi:hypothetical protein
MSFYISSAFLRIFRIGRVGLSINIAEKTYG